MTKQARLEALYDIEHHLNYVWQLTRLLEKDLEMEKEKTIDPSTKIGHLNISLRTKNVLLRAGFREVGDLKNQSRESLMRLRNMGVKSMEETLAVMERAGIKVYGESDIGNTIRKGERKPFPGDYIHKKALLELLKNEYERQGDDYDCTQIMKDIEGMETDADVITLRNAMENPLPEIVQAGEPERKIFVKMTYTDLVIIRRMITKESGEE
jgi:hypothetical protein